MVLLVGLIGGDGYVAACHSCLLQAAGWHQCPDRVPIGEGAE
jgi:hypothetical protein